MRGLPEEKKGRDERHEKDRFEFLAACLLDR